MPLACVAPSASVQEVLFDSGAVRAAVLAETNDYRASKNIPQLKENAALEATATASAVYLAQHEKMGHTADGRNPQWCFISENVWSSFRKPHSEGAFSDTGRDHLTLTWIRDRSRIIWCCRMIELDGQASALFSAIHFVCARTP